MVVMDTKRLGKKTNKKEIIKSSSLDQKGRARKKKKKTKNTF